MSNVELFTEEQLDAHCLELELMVAMRNSESTPITHEMIQWYYQGEYGYTEEQCNLILRETLRRNMITYDDDSNSYMIFLDLSGVVSGSTDEEAEEETSFEAVEENSLEAVDEPYLEAVEESSLEAVEETSLEVVRETTFSAFLNGLVRAVQNKIRAVRNWILSCFNQYQKIE